MKTVSGRLAAAATIALAATGLALQTTDPMLQRLVTRLQAFYTETHPEISYLHLDQAAYAAGETVWFKAYVADGRTHQLDSLSRVLYVDVVSPTGQQVLLRRTLRLRGGLAHGDLALPDTLPQGVYTVRAYTRWMRNTGENLFFARRVPVWQAAPPAAAPPQPSAAQIRRRAAAVTAAATAAAKPDVQFFPEGGDYVAGLPTVLGVKAIDATGAGLAVRGDILDDQNQVQARFATPALGMTAVPFTPAAGRRYRARVTLPSGTAAEYALPAVQPSGWVLNVREVGTNFKVFIRYQRPEGTPAAPTALRLLGHVRGTPVYAGQGQIQGDETFAATIAKANLPAGVLHLTVFDEQQVPRAERLVFVPDANPVRVSVRPDKASYGPRQLVTLDVDVRTAAGQPTAAELSLAVANTAGLPATATTDATVESHLLLTAELKGYVETPGYYFRNSSPDTRLALDHLLLTQGWSRFVWRELLASDASPTANFHFLPEQNLTLGGQLVRPNQKPVPNGTVTLFQRNDKSVTVGQANAAGQFLFTGFPGQDSARVLVQARTEKGGSNVLIRLDELCPLPAQPRPLPLLPPATTPDVAAYGQRSRRQQTLERQFRPDSSRSIVLRNVTVRGARPQPPRDPRSIHGTADATLRLADMPNVASFSNIFQLMQGRVAGVQVTQNGFSYNVQIRGINSISGGTQPLFLLDGMPLSDADALLGIPPLDVERIEVLKGPSAAIYGTRGGNGVIAVFTKRGNPNYDHRNDAAAGVVVRQLPAYYRAREFYAPRYETARPAQPDPRFNTLYWLPRLAVPATGTARVTFYTADQPGTFRITAEGLANTAQPVSSTASLTVQ